MKQTSLNHPGRGKVNPLASRVNGAVNLPYSGTVRGVDGEVIGHCKRRQHTTVPLAKQLYNPRKAQFNARQAVTLQHLASNGVNGDCSTLALADILALFPGVSKRTIQYDLAKLIKSGMIKAQGYTNCKHYTLV